MQFHVHLSKTIPETFGMGRQMNATLRYTVDCKAFQISKLVEDAEGKGFSVDDIHRVGNGCSVNPYSGEEE